jgi:uncharacterized membrane protein
MKGISCRNIGSLIMLSFLVLKITDQTNVDYFFSFLIFISITIHSESERWTYDDMILAFLSVCGSTIHLIIRTRTLTLVSFSQFCRLRHYINPLARGKLPRKLLIYFFELSDGKNLHEETQQYCIRDFPRGQVWTFMGIGFYLFVQRTSRPATF